MQPGQYPNQNPIPPNNQGGGYSVAQNTQQNIPAQPGPGVPYSKLPPNQSNQVQQQIRNQTGISLQPSPNINQSQQTPQPAPQPQQIIPQQQVVASGTQQKQPDQQQQQQKRQANTSQNSLLFSEIRDDMVIMSDGSFRAVIACKSINFDLMSSSERESVEFSYQNFINSLTHPVQILIRSQKVDIGPYLERLVKIRKQQDNMLLGVLMDDYIDFIDILSQEANIMDKSFFVVIPYSSTGDLSNIKDAGKGFFAKLFGASGPNITKIDKITYEKARDEIKNRVDSVTNGLFQMGVHCTRLNSSELGQIYYSYYNPDTAIRQPLGNFEKNTFMYVRKSESEGVRADLNNMGDN